MRCSMRAILLSNGSAIYFNADQTPNVELTAMGWRGLNAFITRYPQGIVSFAYGTPDSIKELPIPSDHVPMLIEKICPPGAESGCPHEHTVVTIREYIQSIFTEHLPLLESRKVSEQDPITAATLAGASEFASNICRDIMNILDEDIALSGSVE